MVIVISDELSAGRSDYTFIGWIRDHANYFRLIVSEVTQIPPRTNRIFSIFH